MSICKIKHFLFSIVLCWAINLYSQPADSTFQVIIDSVEVKATRVALPIHNYVFTIDIVDSQKLGNTSNILSMKEALAEIPSVLINNRFNLSQGDRITIRGVGARAQFGVRGIKILLDGIPLTFVDGQSQLNNLNLNSLERIEIIRGASSSLYGNSSGGVIYVKSSIGNIDKLTIKPELTFGSFGLSKYSFGISSNLWGGGIGVNGFITNSNGYRDHSVAKFGGFNILAEHKLSANLSLNTVINFYNAPYLLNPSSLNKEDADNNPTKSRAFIIKQGTGKKLHQVQAGIALRYMLTKNSEITSSIYGIDRKLLNSIPSNIIELDRFAGGIRFEYINNLSLRTMNIRLLAGLDFEVQNDSRIEYINLGLSSNSGVNPEETFDNLMYGEKVLEQDESVNGLGLFTQLGFEPINRLNLTIGIRYDNYLFEVDDNLILDGINNSDNLYMDYLSPLFGVKYSYLKNHDIYANYATSFQTPTTNELSNNPYAEGGFNESLKPELQRGFEIGIRGTFNHPNLYYNCTVFSNAISDMLVPYQGIDEVTYYRNAGKADNKGSEVLLSWSPLSHFKLTSSYSYIDFIYSDFIVPGEDQGLDAQVSGNFVPGIPKNNLSFSISYLFPFNLSTNLRFSWTDRYYTNDFNGPKPNEADDINNYINDSYFLTNLVLLYRLNVERLKLSIKLGVENILDTRYNDSIVPNAFGNYFFEPASGRAWYFSTTLEI